MIPKKPAVVALLLVILCSGVALVAYGYWARPLRESERAIRDGNFEAALRYCNAAEARFNQLRFTKQLLGSDYEALAGNKLWLLFRLGRLDETIDKATEYPESGFAHFWSACAFFEKARGEEKDESVLGWLNRSQDEFRTALQAKPDDWDAKFNYELTGRLVAEMRKGPKARPEMMKLLRPEAPGGKPVTRKVG